MIQIGEELKKHQFHCDYVYSLSELSKQLSEQRASIILLSDGSSKAQTLDFILGLSTITEAKGSRWVLVLNKIQADLIEIAAASNFRDFVPTSIPQNLWLFRVLYASSRQALDFPIPSAHISLEHPSFLHFPARIVWLNGSRIRIESSITPKVGAKVEVSGDLFGKKGSQVLELQVDKVEQKRLVYRFSSALEGSWTVKPNLKTNFINYLKENAIISSKPKFRVFLGIKSKEVRKQILNHFNLEQYDCNSALQLKSLLFEPSYYSPDILFIEDSLCCGPHTERFKKMLATLEESVPIIIIGTNPEISVHKEHYNDRTIVQMVQVSQEGLSEICRRYLPPIEQLIDMHKATFYLDSDEPLSCVSVKIPGKINSLHSMTANISSPYPIKNFSIIKIESPFLSKWLGKDPWIKVTKRNGTNSSYDKRMTYSASGFIMDLSSSEKQAFATSLSSFISKVLGVSNSGKANSQESEQVESFESKEQSHIEPEKEKPQTEDSALTLVKENALPLTGYVDHASFTHDIKQAVSSLGSKNVLYFFVFVITGFLTLAAVNFMIPKLVKNYKKSGSIYVDQLKKFSGEKE
ncbi:MAG: hypothetical protein HRU09_03485 [Oligoflexales bacterium]|nr:hypothetical protein [Oligoflexales bacterium]